MGWGCTIYYGGHQPKYLNVKRGKKEQTVSDSKGSRRSYRIEAKQFELDIDTMRRMGCD